MSYPTSTVEITLAGVTKTVTIDIAPFKAFVQDLVVATIGQGVARYPSHLDMWPVEEGKSTHANTVVTDAEGKKWHYHLGTSVRNRQARIVGWADDKGITNSADQTRNAKEKS